MILKLLITRGNIARIPREATLEKKENLKIQPEKLKRKKKKNKTNNELDKHTHHKRRVTEKYP